MASPQIKHEKLIRRSLLIGGIAFAFYIMTLSLWVPMLQLLANQYLKDYAQLSLEDIALDKNQIRFKESRVTLLTGEVIDVSFVELNVDFKKLWNRQYELESLKIDRLKTHGMKQNVYLGGMILNNLLLSESRTISVSSANAIEVSTGLVSFGEIAIDSGSYAKDNIEVQKATINQLYLNGESQLWVDKINLDKASIQQMSSFKDINLAIAGIDITKLTTTDIKENNVKVGAIELGAINYRNDMLDVVSLKATSLRLDQAIKLDLSDLLLGQISVTGIRSPLTLNYHIKTAKGNAINSSIMNGHIEGIDSSGISGTINDITINSVDTKNAEVALLRDESGLWQSLPVMEGDNKGAPFEWSIDHLAINNSQITINDKKPSPNFSDHIFIEKVVLKNIGSGLNQAEIQMQATLGKYTPIKLEAEFSNPSDALSVKAKGEVNGLVLNHIDGYIANDLGHNFERGQLSDTFTLVIQDKHMSMSNQLEVRDLKAIPIEGKKGPPLGLAVKLLQDKDGILHITVPIEGDLDNPEFKVAQALTPVITKAVTLAAASNIQPLGTVLLVKDLLDKTLLKVSFEPAFFEAGTAVLSKGQSEKLRELANKLIKTPNLQVRLCGVVTSIDKAASEEAFKKLGEARADAVKKLLLAERLPSDQIIPCPPYRDDAEAAKPRVDITL